jgi:O-antigen/teichoic acid export membrane protein
MAEKQSGAVLRNTLMLVGSQLAGVPLSIVLSAMLGRYLGATDFGYLYLAGTMTSFGFLIVEGGHGNVIAAAVARDHATAGRLFGTSMAWRTVFTLVATGVLWALSIVLGYAPEFRVVLLLVIAQTFIGTVRSACQDVCRGFERLDVAASAQLASQVLVVLFVIPTLLLGGKLKSAIIAQMCAAAMIGAAVWYAMKSIDKQPSRVDRASLQELLRKGSSFLLFSLVMTLQPNIDAVFLSRLSSPAVLGWQAAAQRLMSFVMLPTTALVSALYPTLSRLYLHDREEYQRTAARALQGTSLLAIPATLGCALYRGLSTDLYGGQSFKPVEQNLLLLSPLVFLLYLSMPVGTSILAAGRQRPFAIVQCLCLVSSAVIDPLLIPWFQTHYGNGGLGVCVAGTVSEIAVLLGALPLVPKGILTFGLVKGIGKGLIAGAAMAAVALGLSRVTLTPYVAAPLACAAYVLCLWLIGGIEPEHIEAIRGAVLRKLGRRSRA